MKPRVITTYKILAVALTATAGCATATGAGPEPARSETPVVVPVSAPAQEGSAKAASESPSAQPAPVAQAAVEEAAAAQAIQNAAHRPESQDPKLLALRDEVVSGQRSQILSQVARYRPLCDKDGYPLVGNLHRKGPSVSIQPSEVCAQLRNSGGVH